MRYTITDYKQEMLRYRDKMPYGWLANLLEDNFNEIKKGSSEYKKLYDEIKSTYSGNNYKKGVKKGYINMIREIYAKAHKTNFERLPEQVYPW